MTLSTGKRVSLRRGTSVAPGLFVVFEGIEGAGKSTQVNTLARDLRAGGWEVVTVREPGGTELGERLRQLLRDPAWHQSPLSAISETLLFCAARAELVTKVIRPELESGKIVISDRYVGSTLAYQGHGRGTPLELLEAINELVTYRLQPDLTVLLDLDTETGLARKLRTHDDDDYIGAESVAFHRKVRDGFLSLAERHSWLTIDGAAPQQQVQSEVWRAVQRLIANSAALLPV